jgi:hypothetical protein
MPTRQGFGFRRGIYDKKAPLWPKFSLASQVTSIDLREVGLSQRLMVWAIFSWFVGFFPPAMATTIPFQLYCVYKLARSLKLDIVVIVLSMLLTLVPLICLPVFLALNEKAISALRSGGI